MSSLRTFLAMALLGLSLSVGALQAAEPPTSASVQQSLDRIADRKLADADQKALQAVLQQTLTWLSNQDDYEKRLAATKQQVADAPRQTGENQRELARLKVPKVIPVAQRPANQSEAQRDQQLTERTTQRGHLQKARADANSRSDPRRARPERAQSEISTS